MTPCDYSDSETEDEIEYLQESCRGDDFPQPPSVNDTVYSSSDSSGSTELTEGLKSAIQELLQVDESMIGQVTNSMSSIYTCLYHTCFRIPK